eukprot:CAMPEP_0174968086 /NCGR_PEP_ID=MMETSP0004_2-20121128/7934_1 /TAXON_ID=420556 /ORGANISM="Ochromonas sp., Strain CCMP1393" /LENGTH=678 /DNA_ID=CAMNT_0016217271 /DNA_START=128 /DNA_END=2164 /DNA_ORIENTATION=-
MTDFLAGLGENVFRGDIAKPYLEKQGLSADVLSDFTWASDKDRADKIAAAVLEWAVAHGASVFCHWFQPLGSSGVRHGQTGQVQMNMLEFDKGGKPCWDFKGRDLLKGETDGSSYYNGGLRATHTAGGYLSIDPTSPIFLRGDTIFIPACFVSYFGHALDEKTPLLRSGDALTREGTRLLGLLGYKVKSLDTMIGLEQELFLIHRDAYKKRPDLQLSGRTVMGKMAARGQEMSDHYMAPPSTTSPALACMQEIQREAFKMGIPLKTRHREVAPNQYEFAPLYGTVTTQIDQNLMVMQVVEEVAVKHGLAALFAEKPFSGINGSGKHNNWSISTDDGTNLLNVKQLEARSGSSEIFPVIMAAIVKAINDNGDLMRMAIASPGNDFRLGACEAPPAIVSTYLGEDMTTYLEAYMNGEEKPYAPRTKMLNMGASCLPLIEVPAEDRNRTSPFPYGGHRFEFRAVGSSQNVSLVNTVLATICANAFKEFADAIEGGKTPKQVASEALKASWKTIFNGNGYDPANQEMLTKAGLWRIDSGVDSICRFTDPKNVALFEAMKVLTPDECASREAIMLQQYVGVVEIESQVMIDMMQQHVIPSVKAAGVGPLAEIEKAVSTLKAAVSDMRHTDGDKAQAEKARVLRLETMVSIRETVDAAEAVVPANLWTLATYKELLFMDQEHTI